MTESTTRSADIDPRAFSSELKVGILGGGQLGKMLIQAGSRFNIAFHVMDPSDRAPCRPYAHAFTQGDFADFQDVMNFGRDLDVLTIEIEHVSVDALRELKSLGVAVHPDPDLIAIVQDKGLQKQLYSRLGLATSEFELLDSIEEVAEKVRAKGSAVQKLRKGGYDGKGVARVTATDVLEKGFNAPSVLEDSVDIAKEISFIVARNKHGETRCYPPVEMVFDPILNLVDYLSAPADLDETLAQEGMRMACAIAEELSLVGLLAVETFLDEAGTLLINEVAPRPHNSGHHTIESAVTSQFEQHLRSILGWPLGDTRQTMPAVMLNLIGNEGHSGSPIYDGMSEMLRTPGVYPHLYGKTETRPGRKMGHITITGDNKDEVLQKALSIKEVIGVST